MMQDFFYHPRASQDAEIEKRTVGRENLLRDLVEALRGVSIIGAKESHQPWLIRGLRGVGKTHLLGVLHERIQRDAALARSLHVVWLSETEMYNIYSVGSLMWSILNEIKNSLSSEKHRVLPDFLEIDRESPIFLDKIRSTLRSLYQEVGKVFVLFLENLDLIFDDFSPRSRDQEESALRVILQDAGELMWICTTPKMRSLTFDRKRPLYGLFYERKLHPFSQEESLQLWEKARQQKEHREGVIPEKIDDFAFSLRKRMLHHLTGGRARNIRMLAELMPLHDDLSAMREAFFRVLDIQSVLFEQEMNAVAPRERAILACLALSDYNLEMSEIARKTGLPIRPLSTQIGRLVESGHVERYDLKKEKKTFIALPNGLLRYWYRFRSWNRPEEVWRDFMSLWYPLAPFDAQPQLWQEMEKSVHFFPQDKDFFALEEERVLAKFIFSFFQKKLSFFLEKEHFVEEHFSRLQKRHDQIGKAEIQERLESILGKNRDPRPSRSYTQGDDKDFLQQIGWMFFERRYDEVLSLTKARCQGRELPPFAHSISRMWCALASFSQGETQDAFLLTTQALEDALQTNDEALQEYVFERIGWLRPCVQAIRFSLEKAEREFSLFLGAPQGANDQFWLVLFFLIAIYCKYVFLDLIAKDIPYQERLKSTQLIWRLVTAGESIEDEKMRTSVAGWMLLLALFEGLSLHPLEKKEKDSYLENFKKGPISSDAWAQWLRSCRREAIQQAEATQFEKGWFRSCQEACPVKEEFFSYTPEFFDHIDNLLLCILPLEKKGEKADIIRFSVKLLFSFFEASPEPIPPLLATYRDFRIRGHQNYYPFLWAVRDAMSNRYYAFLALLLLREAWPSLPVKSLQEDLDWLQDGVMGREFPVHEETTRILHVYLEVAKIEGLYEAGLSAQAEEEVWMRWPKESREVLRQLVTEIRKERSVRQKNAIPTPNRARY